MDFTQKLEALGLEHWTTSDGEQDRIYIKRELFKTIFGLELEYYKSGSIKSAKLNGEKISNNKASNLTVGKIYYDCKTKDFNKPLKCIL